ncbi:AAA family ATPase [Pseudomonas putida]|uniref:AAA family ATPase n=1 Tax=Pseudomonas putida TaxID=303 RepID=UPI001E44F8A6|nr:AAA family ATPase [Pseudomonas putida]
MFKSLRLTNFKAWKDTGEISLAPVTMLLGTNSSGKSSLLQSLLLLKQTVRSPDRTIHLNLGGDEVNDLFSFGDFDSVLRQGVDTPRQFSIGFDFKRFDDSRVKAGSLETFYGKTSTGSVAVQQMKLNTDAREFRAVRRDRGAFSIFVDDEAQPRFKGRNYAPERSISFSADAIAELDQDGALAEDLSLSIRRELEGISDSASSVGSAHKAAGKLS